MLINNSALFSAQRERLTAKGLKQREKGKKRCKGKGALTGKGLSLKRILYWLKTGSIDQNPGKSSQGLTCIFTGQPGRLLSHMTEIQGPVLGAPESLRE